MVSGALHPVNNTIDRDLLAARSKNGSDIRVLEYSKFPSHLTVNFLQVSYPQLDLIFVAPRDVYSVS